MEVGAVRMEGSVKLREEGSPPLANALRMAVMLLIVSGVECKPLFVSWVRAGSGSAGTVEDKGWAGGIDERMARDGTGSAPKHGKAFSHELSRQLIDR